MVGLGPIPAVRQPLHRGWDLRSAQRVEINEAFAAIAIVVARELGFPEEIVNVESGAGAHGHAIVRPAPLSPQRSSTRCAGTDSAEATSRRASAAHKASRSLSKSFPEDRKLFVDVRAIGAPRVPSWFLVLTFPMPHQHSVDRRHHIPKMSFKVRNRAEYEAGLRRLGSLTFGSRTQRWNAGGPVDRTAERAIRMRRFRRA
jgi:hypothetical protein